MILHHISANKIIKLDEPTNLAIYRFGENPLIHKIKAKLNVSY